MTETADQGRQLFSPTVVGFLVASVVAVFALSVLLATLDTGGDLPFTTTAASKSAIGHKGFYKLLEGLNLPVSTRRDTSRPLDGPNGLVIVQEPERGTISFDRTSALATAPNVLVVLPKWTGNQDGFHDGWIRDVRLRPPSDPRRLLARIDRSATILRGPAPANLGINLLHETPITTGPMQLIGSSKLKPLIGTAGHILLGQLLTPTQRIWVLADPDPLQNHGIAQSANARFALALVQAARLGQGPIAFDESLHDLPVAARNPLQLLFTFPFVIVTLQLLAAIALLLFATTSRFGGIEEAPPPFAIGKARLIDNIASLMDRAGHQAVVLRRYLSARVSDAGRALHAPQGLAEPDLGQWLDRAGATRGIATKVTPILARSAQLGGRRAKSVAALFAEANNIFRWHKDILDGSGRHQGDR